ncbi:hypothetical protein SAMN04488004_107202 [Loktanella salsilacus]|uniref:Uncharacterized protein n=2 Tax=Loktanella salsilacus TaxID=195913 RepID=A0A1I4EZ99_9RHOB|nr:hypothetical protein SAMN04488004_107202 [Loktanella salsilacus]
MLPNPTIVPVDAKIAGQLQRWLISRESEVSDNNARVAVFAFGASAILTYATAGLPFLVSLGSGGLVSVTSSVMTANPNDWLTIGGMRALIHEGGRLERTYFLQVPSGDAEGAVYSGRLYEYVDTPIGEGKRIILWEVQGPVCVVPIISDIP